MRIGHETAMTQACPYMSECYKCKLCMNIEIQMVNCLKHGEVLTSLLYSG